MVRRWITNWLNRRLWQAFLVPEHHVSLPKIERLLKWGADPNFEMCIEVTARQELYKHTPLTPLMFACISRREELCALLLRYGAGVTAQESQFGRSPLAFCAMYSMEWDMKKNHGWNSRVMMVRGSDLKIAKLLVKHGADPFGVDHHQKTLFDMVEDYERTLWETTLLELAVRPQQKSLQQSIPETEKFQRCARQRL